MAHTPILRKLKEDLDDLKVRNPKKYDENEEILRRLQHKASVDVSTSPAFRRIERRP